MSGLESTLIILNVMIADNMPKSIISEEVLFPFLLLNFQAIEDAIGLCKVQLRKYIFPFYDINYSKANDEEEAREEKVDDMDVEEARK